MAVLQTPEFWVAIGFLSLMALIAKPTWKAITASLDTRAQKIQITMSEAAGLREEVQSLLADYQRKQRDAAHEVDEMLANAKTLADAQTKEFTNSLADSLKRREQLTKDKILQAEADALFTVRNTAIDIAIAATQSILTEQLDDSVKEKLINNSITQLAGNLN
jgi:F-type H+-transporting ATPase subunit b